MYCARTCHHLLWQIFFFKWKLIYFLKKTKKKTGDRRCSGVKLKQSLGAAATEGRGKFVVWKQLACWQTCSSPAAAPQTEAKLHSASFACICILADFLSFFHHNIFPYGAGFDSKTATAMQAVFFCFVFNGESRNGMQPVVEPVDVAVTPPKKEGDPDCKWWQSPITT